MKGMAQARLKRVRAVELLSQGLSYDEIARQVGFSHRGSAHRAVSKALAEREAQDIDDLRALECSRLDAVQAAYWEKAMEGDVRAAAVVLRVMDQRERLLGLHGARNNSGGDDRPRTMIVGAEGNPGDATSAESLGQVTGTT